MSGESVPLATGEGCRVMYCIVVYCHVMQFSLEFCLEAFFISSVGYMPYCPVVFRPVSRCFVTCCYETGLLAIYPAQPTKGRSLFRFGGVMFCLVMFGLFGFIGVISCILADVQARKYECFHIIWYAYQQCVEFVMLCRLLSCQDLFRQMLYLPIMFSYLIGKCEG